MLTTPQVPSARARGPRMSEAELSAFADELDMLRAEIEADLGVADTEHIRRIARISSALEISGRALIHFSLEPLSFSAGVAALWAHKCLELMEIGHMALHGSFESLPDSEPYHRKGFRWKAPIDEESWQHGHNVRHHQYTNIGGADPDLDFGTLRLSAQVPHKEMHDAQPVSNVLTWLGFALAIQMHVTGLLELHFPSAEAAKEPVDPAKRKQVHRKFAAKPLRYYAREYMFFPLLAGPFAAKVLLGNALSELGRDLYAAATIYCGHVGAADYEPGTRADSRARWYVMQAEGARDIRVPRVVSILCGALDRQIEHHLFPQLPPNRLREIAPRVKALCEKHGVRYLEDSWPATLREVFAELKRLSAPDAQPLGA